MARGNCGWMTHGATAMRDGARATVEILTSVLCRLCYDSWTAALYSPGATNRGNDSCETNEPSGDDYRVLGPPKNATGLSANPPDNPPWVRKARAFQ